MHKISSLDVQFICPACGQKAGASTDGTVIHGWPACGKFLALSPTDYLAYVRKHYETSGT